MRCVAVIREDDCVGCGKCLAPCPVDAIIGAEKFLHVVLTEECIGCELCVSPCPMDCIEMIEQPGEQQDAQYVDKEHRAAKAKQRYLAKIKRATKEQYPRLSFAENDPNYKNKIRSEIAAAVSRVTERRGIREKQV